MNRERLEPAQACCIMACSVITTVVIAVPTLIVLGLDATSLFWMPPALFRMHFDCLDVGSGNLSVVGSPKGLACAVTVHMDAGWDARLPSVECARVLPGVGGAVDVVFNRHALAASECLRLVFSASDVPDTPYDQIAAYVTYMVYCWAVTALIVALIGLCIAVERVFSRRATSERVGGGPVAVDV
jgi:hypothetical protein